MVAQTAMKNKIRPKLSRKPSLMRQRSLAPNRQDTSSPLIRRVALLTLTLQLALATPAWPAEKNATHAWPAEKNATPASPAEKNATPASPAEKNATPAWPGPRICDVRPMVSQERLAEEKAADEKAAMEQRAKAIVKAIVKRNEEAAMRDAAMEQRAKAIVKAIVNRNEEAAMREAAMEQRAKAIVKRNEELEAAQRNAELGRNELKGKQRQQLSAAELQAKILRDELRVLRSEALRGRRFFNGFSGIDFAAEELISDMQEVAYTAQ